MVKAKNHSAAGVNMNDHNQEESGWVSQKSRIIKPDFLRTLEAVMEREVRRQETRQHDQKTGNEERFTNTKAKRDPRGSA